MTDQHDGPDWITALRQEHAWALQSGDAERAKAVAEQLALRGVDVGDDAAPKPAKKTASRPAKENAAAPPAPERAVPKD